jgi:Tol biopolymer transport system component
MDWSSDGSAIYAYAERESQLGDIWKVPVDGSEPERLTTIGSAISVVVSWVREAQEILVLQLDEGIQTVVKRSSSGRLTPFTRASDGNVNNFGVSPDGEIALLTFLSPGQLEGRLVRWTDGSPLTSLPPNSRGLGWSTDSRRLLYGISAGVGNVGDLGILDIATGDTTRVTTTPEDEPQASFTADGNAVILRRMKTEERVMRADLSGLLGPRPSY